MTLQAARALQKVIQGPGFGLHCIVPLGHGPAGYFCRIFTNSGQVDFHDSEAAAAYRRRMKRRQAKAHREYLRMQREILARRDRRSPLDRMIDQACGLERKD